MKNFPLGLIVRVPSAKRSSGFTLVEMLVVVSIMLALMGLVSTALVGIGRAHSLANAGNQITAMVSLARQNSVTKNALTALVIPAGKKHWDACILYELTPRADGNQATTADWRPVSKWAALPPGIVIDDCEFAAQGTPKQFPDLPTIIPADGDPVTSYRYIVFIPTGALYPFPFVNAGSSDRCTENPMVRLVEGMRIGEDAGDVKYRETGKADHANFYRVTILGATGVPKIDRL